MEKKEIIVTKKCSLIEELSALGINYVNIKKMFKNKDIKVIEKKGN